MGDTIQFVDSIASSPTVLLDLNDLDTVGSGFASQISCPPPRLRRSVSQNAMRDGIYVSSSNYEARPIVLEQEMRASSQDNLATEWQTLARILDQPSILKYQPTGATKPVFFKVYRSEVPAIEDMLAAAAFRRPTVELLAEPFAYGLAETFSPSWTMNGASGGMEYTCPTILGDVAAPLNIDLTANLPDVFQLSSLAYPTARTYPTIVRAGTNGDFTLGTDASTTTGAGTGFWNADYIGVSFATPTAAVRATATAVALLQPGDYRVFGKFEMTAGTADVYVTRNVQTSIVPAYGAIQTGPTVEVATTPQTLYMGDFRVPFFDTTGDSSSMPATTRWDIVASRTSGAGSLRIDGLLFVATNTDHGPLVRLLDVNVKSLPPWFGSPVLRIDSAYQRLVRLNSTSFAEIQLPEEYVGGFPMVLPGHNNRLRLIPKTPFATSVTTSGTATYYPQYLHVRPSAS